jgi:protein ImuB
VPPLACVSIQELPLQLAIRMHPEWRELPVAVLGEDRPTGIVLHRNRAAARTGVRRGMRYSAALALSSLLRAAVLSPEDLSSGVETLNRILAGFSPRVEPFGDGVFWLDAGGLGYLYPTVQAWMGAILRDLEAAGFRARIASGFTRGGTLVASRRSRGDAPPLLFSSAAEEQAFCMRSPLGALPLAPSARTRLTCLGITDVGGFLSLPAEGLRMRLGAEAERLHGLLAASRSLPLQFVDAGTELVESRRFDGEVQDSSGLEPSLEEALGAVVSDAEKRGLRIRELALSLTMEDGSTREERILPSEPTVAFGFLRDLVRLRVAGLFRGVQTARRQGITGFTLSAERSKSQDEQVELIRSTKSRDRAAAARAFALIRAELGNDAVRRACVRPEHQPEKQYSWETVGGSPPGAGCPLEPSGKVLVRRIFESPRPLPPVPRPRAYRGCGGPYAVSGAWWSRPYSRRYRFIEAANGTILWIFREGESTPWLVQGLLA